MDDTDALAKLDALPPNLRRATRGIIPTARGYALRVIKEAEADVTAVVTPEIAAQMGPALGLKGTSAWVVCGIPRNAAKEGIIRALNAPSSRWRGWTVRPLRTITEPRGGKVDWLVEADVDPPARALTVKSSASPHGDCIMVKKCTEEKKVSPKAAPWYKPRQQKEMAPPPKSGALWSDIADEDDDDDFTLSDQCEINNVINSNYADNRGDDDLPGGQYRSEQSEQPPIQRDARGEAVARRMRAAGFRVPQAAVNGEAQQAGGGQQPTQPSGEANSQIIDMLNKMQEAMMSKDSLITQLQDTIRNLNAQIASMTATLASLQSAAVPPQPPGAAAATAGGQGAPAATQAW